MRRRKIYRLSVLLLVAAANAATCAAQDKPDAPTPKQSDAPATQSSSTEKAKAPAGAPSNTSGQATDPQLNRMRIQNGFWASFPTSSPRMTSRKTKRPLLLEKNTFSRTIRRSISAPTLETPFRPLSNRRVMGSLTMDKGGGPTPSDSGQRKQTRSRRLFSYLAFCRMC